MLSYLNRLIAKAAMVPKNEPAKRRHWVLEVLEGCFVVVHAVVMIPLLLLFALTYIFKITFT